MAACAGGRLGVMRRRAARRTFTLARYFACARLRSSIAHVAAELGKAAAAYAYWEDLRAAKERASGACAPSSRV